MINVFISHNCKDKPMARKIAKELNKYGIKTWVDESEIRLGDSLIEKIRDGLDHMDFLIALISASSVQSEWVKRELDIAINSEIEGKRIVTIPILVGKCELPSFLKGKLYADMSTLRKYNENMQRLIRRFDINEIEDDKNEFTEFKLNAVQVIEKIENIVNVNETIEFLESFGYSERSLFYRDTFIQAINKLLENEKTPLDVLVSLIDICKYCPNNVVIKISLTQLLNRKEEQVLQSTIAVLGKTKSLKIQQKKILKILKDCSNPYLEKCIWDYFLVTQIDIHVAEELWEFIEEKLEVSNNNKIVMCMCKLYNQLSDDKIFERWYNLWQRGNEKEKRSLVNCLCQYGFQNDGVYLVSPKLRYSIKEVLFNSFGTSDTDNANIMIVLLTAAGNIIENNQEVWHKLMSLDEYSILLTLEMLRDEYNIAYVFNSSEDVKALKEISASLNKNIKKVALEIIAEINLKEALDIIDKEDEFIFQYYNPGSVLYTIVKETNVEDYENLFKRIKVKIDNEFSLPSERNLICIGEYILGEIDLETMINKIQIGQDGYEKAYGNAKKTKLVVEKLKDFYNIAVNGDKKKIQTLLKNFEGTIYNY